MIDVSAADVREAPDVREDLAELVRPLPGDRPGTDAPRTDAGRSPGGPGRRSACRSFDLGQDLFEEEAGVLIGERVVLEAAVLRPRIPAPLLRQLSLSCDRGR